MFIGIFVLPYGGSIINSICQHGFNMLFYIRIFSNGCYIVHRFSPFCYILCSYDGQNQIKMNEQSGKYKGMVKRRMNIFVFGNGFDLAHGLYTKYIYDMGDLYQVYMKI